MSTNTIAKNSATLSIKPKFPAFRNATRRALRPAVIHYCPGYGKDTYANGTSVCGLPIRAGKQYCASCTARHNSDLHYAAIQKVNAGHGVPVVGGIMAHPAREILTALVASAIGDPRIDRAGAFALVSDRNPENPGVKIAAVFQDLPPAQVFAVFFRADKGDGKGSWWYEVLPTGETVRIASRQEWTAYVKAKDWYGPVVTAYAPVKGADKYAEVVA